LKSFIEKKNDSIYNRYSVLKKKNIQVKVQNNQMMTDQMQFLIYKKKEYNQREAKEFVQKVMDSSIQKVPQHIKKTEDLEKLFMTTARKHNGF